MTKSTAIGVIGHNGPRVTSPVLTELEYALEIARILSLHMAEWTAREPTRKLCLASLILALVTLTPQLKYVFVFENKLYTVNINKSISLLKM